MPCKNQEKFWKIDQKQRYNNILNQADIVNCLQDKYTFECMLERNKYMINNSSLCIALYNGEKGGTKYTIDYAKSKNVKTIIISPN